MGYLRWAPNVTVEKMEITFFPDRESNLGRLRFMPTLHHVNIKAGLYRKAVQVCYIPQHMFSWRNKKDISIFGMKKSALSVAIKYPQDMFP